MDIRCIILGLLISCAALIVPAWASVTSTGVAIDIGDRKQVIHSFGASDAWTCQFVGENWPIDKRRAIADLLFSMNVDRAGNPKGIGLSMWRFNVGAGSAEQGDASGIHTPWHRAECFRNADGSYDWNRQKGQQWFLEAANRYGVPYLLAFTISPPVHFTLNGIAHSDPGRTSLNIRKDAMPDFADFLADVAEHFHKKGVTLDYISPVNEPQWAWDSSKQEGTPGTNAEIFELTRLIADCLRARGIPSKVAIAEAATPDYLTGPVGDKPCADQIKAFWDPASPTYIGSLPQVARVISGHSYFTTWPISAQVSTREELRNRISEISALASNEQEPPAASSANRIPPACTELVECTVPPTAHSTSSGQAGLAYARTIPDRETDPELAYWQSEFCILEANDEIGGGRGRDLGMDTALYVARVIHTDLTVANASHWAWWLAVSGADYKDGLVYIEKADDTGPDPLMRDGRVLTSKTLWVLGNFSRFVRPGMVRVALGAPTSSSAPKGAREDTCAPPGAPTSSSAPEGAHEDTCAPPGAPTSPSAPEDARGDTCAPPGAPTSSSASEGLMLSAYLDKKTRQIVIVAINVTTNAQPLRITNPKVHGDAFTTYTTSKTADLRKGKTPADKITIPARSVVTLVGELAEK